MKWGWIVLVVVLILVASGGYFGYDKMKKSSQLKDFHIAMILCTKECPLEKIVINYTDDIDFVGNRKEADYYEGAEFYYSPLNDDTMTCTIKCMNDASKKYYEGEDINKEVEFKKKTNFESVIYNCSEKFFSLIEIKSCFDNHLREYYSEKEIENIREDMLR